ncbi:HepT-like ribonuclease domain-containing protein [Kushneria aurantia]|uniref:DUF86 domain-containing protein n=1 Tax=Kushneria aurantia TaxID=504092 RepID=A0ABV6G5B5_9GAMM|nr:DUF86 domain-containing protein [Kushneria aurantia]
MKAQRLRDHLKHMRQAAADARDFTDGMEKETFFADRRTQQAVVMSLVIVGEAAARIMDGFPAFIRRHDAIPWRNMRGMRNRIAHGYFEINLDIVWNTLQTALPTLLVQLSEACVDAENEISGE